MQQFYHDLDDWEPATLSYITGHSATLSDDKLSSLLL